MHYSKKGFTLFEIMVVMAMIAIFFTATSYMTRDSRVNQTSAERFANTVYDTIRNARNNMIIGRGVFSGASLIVTTQRTVDITTMSISTVYQDGSSNTGTESKLVIPFLNNDKNYTITNIAVSSGGIVNGVVPLWDYTGATSAAIILKPNGDIAINAIKSGVPLLPPPASIRTLKITLGYLGFEYSVVVDRVTGTIEVKKSIDD